MRLNRYSCLTAVCLGLAGVSLAYGDTGGCFGNEPLIVGYGGSSDSGEAPAFVGEWHLPISADSPEIMTDALVRVDIVTAPNGRGVSVAFNFSFPDPNPWGVPFTFQRAELSWESAGNHFSTLIDWSDDCSGPGKSMFPHQAFTALSDVDSSSLKGGMEMPIIKIWGSRN